MGLRTQELPLVTDALSPRLLSAVHRNKRVSRRFDLKMTEFTTDMFEAENCKPTSAPKLSLSLKKSCGNFAAKRPRKALQPSNGRFSESDYSDMAVLFVPSNTKKNNEWAHNNFVAWRDARNKENPENPCPEDLYKQPFDVVALSLKPARVRGISIQLLPS